MSRFLTASIQVSSVFFNCCGLVIKCNLYCIKLTKPINCKDLSRSQSYFLLICDNYMHTCIVVIYYNVDITAAAVLIGRENLDGLLTRCFTAAAP